MNRLHELELQPVEEVQVATPPPVDAFPPQVRQETVASPPKRSRVGRKSRKRTLRARQVLICIRFIYIQFIFVKLATFAMLKFYMLGLEIHSVALATLKCYMHLRF